MMKPITGQYECIHRSGVGLDYFTSRIDRLTLQTQGRFSLIVQDRSRVSNAAQSLISGQQVTTAAPETRREGHYTFQGSILSLLFDDGIQLQGQLSPNGEGFQIKQDFYNKISDSTLLPSADRLKKDMEDIAKGLKIAGAIGSMAIKAAKTIHNTIQSAQEPGPNQAGATKNAVPQQPAQSFQSIAQPPVQPRQPVSPANQPLTGSNPQPAQQQVETLYCDQCGARCRPGKRFCNNCGAQLV